jgi:hypothetical protein
LAEKSPFVKPGALRSPLTLPSGTRNSQEVSDEDVELAFDTSGNSLRGRLMLALIAAIASDTGDIGSSFAIEQL